jgi:hypothetical protein
VFVPRDISVGGLNGALRIFIGKGGGVGRNSSVVVEGPSQGITFSSDEQGFRSAGLGKKDTTTATILYAFLLISVVLVCPWEWQGIVVDLYQMLCRARNESNSLKYYIPNDNI